MIKLGILGAGLAVEQLHWPALRELREQFSITALCDIDPAAMARTAALVGGNPLQTTRWDTLLSADIDAVLISLPIHLNGDAIRAAVRAGKHVICEKPLAANLAQGEALAAELRGAPVTLLIAENFHYRDDLKQARAWLDAGRIGQIVAISIQACFWADTSEGFASTPWRHDHQYRGSMVADACVHQTAALRELGGPIEQVHAFTKDVHPVIGGVDTIALNVRFRSGVLGQMLFASAVRPAQPSGGTVLILGTAGSVTLSDGKAHLHCADGEGATYTASDPGGYRGEFENFYAAVTAGAPVVCTMDEALADLRIVMRALDAAESRSVILIEPEGAV